MQIFKSIIRYLGMFILALILIGILLPKKDKVYYERSISCSPSDTYEQFRNLKNWEKWSYWHTLDKDMKLQYSSVLDTVGSYYIWDGNKKVGKGKVEISELKQDQEIAYLMTFGDFEPSTAKIFIKPYDKGSYVKWQMNIEQSENTFKRILMGGYQYIFFKYFITKDYKRNLNNLNSLCIETP